MDLCELAGWLQGMHIQLGPFIVLIFGSIGMDHVMRESCNKATILQTLRNYRKMTISWSFTYNSFVKFHGKILGSLNMTVLYPDLCYKGTALYHINIFRWTRVNLSLL